MGNCSIVCQDYREYLDSLPDNSVDLMLTDPPYAISRDTGFANVVDGESRFAVSMDFGDWDSVPIDLTALSQGAYRVIRQGGTVIVWYDIWKTSYLHDALAAAGFKMLRLVVWNKTNPVPLNSKRTYLSNSREVAVVGVKGGKPVFNSEYDNGNYHAPIPRHGGKRVHPTQKPIGLFQELVQKHSNKGGLVIDPFLGSGTTAVASLREGRSFSGCDISEEYVGLATARVRQDNWQGGMF